MRYIFYHSKRYAKLRNIMPADAVICEIPSYGSIRKRAAKAVKLVTESMTRQYDFLLADSTWVSLWFCIMLGKICDLPVVLRLRGNPFGEYLQKRMLLSYLIERHFLKKVDFIISVSEFLKKEMLRYGIKRRRIWVLNTPAVPALSSTASRKRDVFLFVTNFDFWAKVAILPATIDRIASVVNKNGWNYELFIVGEGKYKNRIRRMVDIRWKNSAVFTGYREDVDSFYKRAKIFFHFSRFDAYPTVVQEALAYGVPVLSSDYGSIREQIEHRHNGLVVTSLDELPRYLELLIGNEEMYRQMSANAILSARKWQPKVLRMQLDQILSLCSRSHDN